jgi:hypothetical protein
VEPGLVNRALLLESSLYSANAVVSNTVVVDLLDPGEKAGCRHPAVFFSLSFTILALLLVRKYRALGSVRDCAVELAVRYVCAGREVPSGKMGITGGGRSGWSVQFLNSNRGKGPEARAQRGRGEGRRVAGGGGGGGGGVFVIPRGFYISPTSLRKVTFEEP